ncbi:hypothetical protein [Legionella quinlivanii]|nr:hypothetical protein [Legionella quinlivanii]
MKIEKWILIEELLLITIRFFVNYSCRINDIGLELKIATFAGICGQHIYINRKEKIVIVVLSARPKPVAITTVNDGEFFAAVVKALH